MIATLYDIHGNLAALEAVLAEVPADATIVVGGDVCAGGPQPSETLERLRGLGDRVRWIRGNADRELMPGELGLAPVELIDATREQLDRGADRVPVRESSERPDRPHALLHASPRNDVDIFTERTPEERIAFLFEDVDADTVVVGHVHAQYDRTVAGKRVVNSGSVGMPYEEEPGAYWTARPRRRGAPRTTAPSCTTLARGGGRAFHARSAL